MKPALISSLLALSMAGCGPSILSQYEDAKLEALADPGAAPASWTADGELGISWDLVTALAVRELQQRLESPDSTLKIQLPLGATATIVPDVELKDTTVGPAKACEACVKVEAGFDGELDWTLGSLDGAVPIDIDVTSVLEVATRESGDSTVVEATMRRASVTLPEGLQVNRLRVDLEGPLIEWLEDRIEQEFPPVPLAEIGDEDLPVRALRLAAEQRYLQIEVLTSSPVRSGTALVPKATGDWYLALDETVLLGLARREAFEAGELDYEVYADPRSLHVDHQAFTMGLRLWRLAGAGWWRDYQVSGTLSLEDGEIGLEPKTVVEQEASRGAAFVDPLALLAQGIILDTIEDALRIARPAELSEPIGGAKLVLTVDSASGGNGALSLKGSATIEEKSKGGKQKQTKKKKAKGSRGQR